MLRGELLNLLGEILGLISEENIESFTPTYLKKLRRLKHVIRYISEHYRDPITLDELARQCGMNSNYFCRAFKGFTGMTPVEYLNFYRVESACERILRSEEMRQRSLFNPALMILAISLRCLKNIKGSPLHNIQKILTIQ